MRPQNRESILAAKILMVLSASIILTLGVVHLVYTFWGPKLTPRDPALQISMSQIAPVITKETTMAREACSGNSASAILDYKAAGLIFKSMLAGTLDRAQAQWAIWGLFSTNAKGNSFFTAINGAGIDATYLAEAQTAPGSSFNGLSALYPARREAGIWPAGVHRHRSSRADDSHAAGYGPDRTGGCGSPQAGEGLRNFLIG